MGFVVGFSGSFCSPLPATSGSSFCIPEEYVRPSEKTTVGKVDHVGINVGGVVSSGVFRESSLEIENESKRAQLLNWKEDLHDDGFDGCRDG